MFVGAKEGQLIELVGDQSPNPETPPRSKRGRSKGDVRRETVRGAMRKSRDVRVIDKKVKSEDQIKYFLSRG